MYKGERQHCAELLIHLDDTFKKVLSCILIGIKEGIYIHGVILHFKIGEQLRYTPVI